jgi:radical SAM protein
MIASLDRSPDARAGGYHREDLGHSPLVVFYELTRACDLVCQHCRACAQPLPDPRELPPHLSRHLMDQLTGFPKPPLVVLTGGDPLKRSDIFDLVRYATGLGLSVAVTPSATPLVTGEALDRLREAGVSRLAISLDGADAASHDALRGLAGSYRRTLEILGAARQRAIPVQVNTTLTPANFDQIEAMAALIAEYDIVLWSVFFLVPVGRATHLARLSAAECEKAFERLWHESLRQPYPIKTTEAPHLRRYVLEQRRAGSHEPSSARPTGPSLAPHATCGVNDGKGVMFVSHIGLIYPSGFLPIPCGLFPDEDVRHIYQNSPVFRALRDAGRLKGKCGVCSYRHICGGSRARAYALTGDLAAEEPDCAYIPPAK